jgi:hypothetical protein
MACRYYAERSFLKFLNTVPSNKLFKSIRLPHHWLAIYSWRQQRIASQPVRIIWARCALQNDRASAPTRGAEGTL